MPRLTPDGDVGTFQKSSAKSVDEIDHRIDQRDLAPEGRQHVDRIEGAAEKGQRRHHEERHELQLFEAVGPDCQG